jgi:hypothetical protein
MRSSYRHRVLDRIPGESPDERRRQRRLLQGRHETRFRRLPERALRECRPPPPPPSIERPQTRAELAAEDSGPPLRDSVAHRGQERDHHTEVVAAAQEPHRRRRRSLPAVQLGATEAEAAAELPGKTTDQDTPRPPRKVRHVERAAARACLLPSLASKLFVELKESGIESGVPEEFLAQGRSPVVVANSGDQSPRRSSTRSSRGFLCFHRRP